MEKKWITSGLFLIIFAIVLGAFGAHGLKSVTQDQGILIAFDTATKYQFFQGLGMLIIPFILQKYALSSKFIFSFQLAGTLLFSGSIYLLTVAKIQEVMWLKYAMIPLTPIGGVLMILAWSILVLRTLKAKV